MYDFFYLPIDFRNKCNVGYAFINFIEPPSVLSFFSEFNNRKWARFNSEKVCAITYARIQGKMSLVEHFRNSSVMHEELKYRPLIFVSEGPQAGTLEMPLESFSTRGECANLGVGERVSPNRSGGRRRRGGRRQNRGARRGHAGVAVY